MENREYFKFVPCKFEKKNTSPKEAPMWGIKHHSNLKQSATDCS